MKEFHVHFIENVMALNAKAVYKEEFHRLQFDSASKYILPELGPLQV